MKTALIAGTLLALVALAGAFAPGAAVAQTNVCQTNPGPPDAADPDITVSSPTANAMVTSPVTVTGQARTFESNVQVRMFDASGAEAGSAFGTANAPDAGQLGPYTIELTFTASAGDDLCLWVFESSAETGDPINVVQVPVQVAGAEASPTAALPATGAAQPGSGDLGTPLIAAALLAAFGSAALVGASLLRARR
ncbi:MAG: Gmad2 immunoglobulin-like domain-containing protein [Dehalococcoidia bacterium]